MPGFVPDILFDGKLWPRFVAPSSEYCCVRKQMVWNIAGKHHVFIVGGQVHTDSQAFPYHYASACNMLSWVLPSLDEGAGCCTGCSSVGFMHAHDCDRVSEWTRHALTFMLAYVSLLGLDGRSWAFMLNNLPISTIGKCIRFYIVTCIRWSLKLPPNIFKKATAWQCCVISVIQRRLGITCSFMVVSDC